MCHVSGGHIARVFEAAGLPTVVVASGVFGAQLAPMRLPRLLLTRHIMGRPLGPPGDAERQREVLRAALDLLQNAPGNGALVEMPGQYRPGSG